MSDLVKDLNTASRRLVFALEEYVDACSAIQEHCASSTPGRKLADRVANESLLTRSLESQLRKATSMINYAKNYSLPKVTINSLPSEILVHIFHLVVGHRPCGVRKHSGEKIRFPKYPDYLSHVCSRWRKLALGAPTLWTHIDHVPYHSLSAAFDDRAFELAERAEFLPLHFHIYEPAFLQEYDHENLLEFLTDTSFAIQSLEIVLPETSKDFSREYLDILSTHFHNCLPTLFNELTIVDAGESAPTLLWPAGDVDDVDDGFWVDINEEIYKRMLPLKALRLDGIYFPWDNPIYLNLVDLRLTSSRKPAAMITQSRLCHILQLNLKLQILHFGLDILHPNFPTATALVPVRLPELQVLNLSSMERAELGTLTRLLDPGPQALQFSITLDEESPPVYDDEVLKFVSGSRITKLHIIAEEVMYLKRIDLVHKLLHPAPHVQELAMAGFHWPREFDIASGLCECIVDRAALRLEVLYLLNSHIYLHVLRQIARSHPTKKIVLWDCKVLDLGDRDDDLSESEIKSGLSSVCKSVRVIEGGPSPVEHWEW